MVMARKSLGDYMLEKGYASPAQVEEARKAQQNTRGDIAKIMIDMGLNPRDIYESKAQEMGVPFVDLTVYKIDPSAINVVPEHIAKKNNVIPVRKDNNVLFVAMADTNNLQAQDSLRLVSRCQIRPVLAVPDHIEDAVNRNYGGGVTVEGTTGSAKGGMNPLKNGGAAELMDTDT